MNGVAKFLFDDARLMTRETKKENRPEGLMLGENTARAVSKKRCQVLGGLLVWLRLIGAMLRSIDA